MILCSVPNVTIPGQYEKTYPLFTKGSLILKKEWPKIVYF